MEGYFPVHQYCKLTGVSKDTAHHRAIRGTIPAFKGIGNRWFLYFSDEGKNGPEGFITIEEFCKNHGYKGIHGCLKAIIFEKINANDAKLIYWVDKTGKPHRQYYIRENVDYPNEIFDIQNYVRKKMDYYRPEGHLTVSEWCKRENVRNHYVWNRIYKRNGIIDEIPYVISGDHYYIPEEFTINKGN